MQHLFAHDTGLAVLPAIDLRLIFKQGSCKGILQKHRGIHIEINNLHMLVNRILKTIISRSLIHLLIVNVCYANVVTLSKIHNLDN